MLHPPPRGIAGERLSRPPAFRDSLMLARDSFRLPSSSPPSQKTTPYLYSVEFQGSGNCRCEPHSVLDGPAGRIRKESFAVRNFNSPIHLGATLYTAKRLSGRTAMSRDAREEEVKVTRLAASMGSFCRIKRRRVFLFSARCDRGERGIAEFRRFAGRGPFSLLRRGISRLEDEFRVTFPQRDLIELAQLSRAAAVSL